MLSLIYILQNIKRLKKTIPRQIIFGTQLFKKSIDKVYTLLLLRLLCFVDIRNIRRNN